MKYRNEFIERIPNYLVEEHYALLSLPFKENITLFYLVLIL